MAYKIVFFEDSLEIYERGIGYFDDATECEYGSIHVAFEDAFHECRDEWQLNLLITKSKDESKNSSKENLVEFLDPDNFEIEISEKVSGYDKVFVFMDSYWCLNETIRDQTIHILVKRPENIYFCAYSSVGMDMIEKVVTQFEELNYDKKVNTFMLDRGDAPILYNQCYNVFKRLLLISQGTVTWDNDIDLTDEFE